MKNKLIALIAILFLCTACAPKPSSADVDAVLMENIPDSFRAVAAVEQTQSDISNAGDDVLVKFKSHLKLGQPLFVPANFETVAQGASADTSLFNEIEKGTQGLSATARQSMAQAIQAATAKPMFLVQASATGTAVEWYGSFKAKKLVDKWVASDFRTDIAPKFVGQPRSAFSQAAIDSAEASAWFAQTKVRQVALLEKIDMTRQLEKKDAEAEQERIDHGQMLTQKEAELAQARVMAQRELAEKQSLIAQQQEQARQLPVSVRFRRAALGSSSVIQLQAALPITVKMVVVRGAQQFDRNLQIQPGRTIEVGHLEGWGFRSGDQVTLSNPSFDSVFLAVP